MFFICAFTDVIEFKFNGAQNYKKQSLKAHGVLINAKRVLIFFVNAKGCDHNQIDLGSKKS